MTKRSNTRPQAEQPADTLSVQRERAARLRDAAGRFIRPAAETAPEAPPASPDAPVEPAERPTLPGRIPAPRDTHPETYALGVADDSLGSHAARGASVIVEPVTPAGAGLAVVYLRGQGPRVFDLTHNFDPEHAPPSAPGSDVEVLIEVALPETGRVGFLRADSVEKIHRVTGIYTPDAAMRGFRPAPPRLPVMRTCPEGMGTHRVEDAVAYPLVRPGEMVVYDGMRREPTHGALCVLQWNNGSRSVLLTNQRPLGNSGDDSWCVDPVNRPPSREAAERRIVAGPPGAMLYASDGPYSTDLLREKIVGTVVGILVPGRDPAPQDEPDVEAPASALKTSTADAQAETAPEAKAAPVYETDPAEIQGDTDRLCRERARPADGSHDAELLRLGRRFQDAAAREIEACAAINAAAAEAQRHKPAFPACLTLTTADHELNVYQHWTHPEALEGITLGGADVDWLRRRMPIRHEVLRPIREGERAHIDHPGRKFDIVPHPEAQARAQEIVAAYDAWRTELRRVHDEYVPPALETAADAAGEIAAAIASEIAALPACTAAGFRVKLRALLHYERDALTAELPELPDPDQVLGHSILQDVLRDGFDAAVAPPGNGDRAGALSSDDEGEPVTVESAALLPFEAMTPDSTLRSPKEWAADFAEHALGMHAADKTLRMSKPELIAFVRTAAERGNGTDEAVFKAIDYAREAFDGWAQALEMARARYLVAASAMTVEDAARQADQGGEA